VNGRRTQGPDQGIRRARPGLPGATLRHEMIAVGAYPTRSDAELAQTALAAAGIPSVLAADDAGAAYPFDLAGGARLLVDDANAEDAAAVLSAPPPAHRKEQP
jgi:hypothetical protein